MTQNLIDRITDTLLWFFESGDNIFSKEIDHLHDLVCAHLYSVQGTTTSPTKEDLYLLEKSVEIFELIGQLYIAK